MGFKIKDTNKVGIQDIAGEVHSLLDAIQIGFCRDYTYERSRFDFVIVNRNTNEAIAVFEIRSLSSDKEVRGKRIDKYGSCGVPLFCFGHIKSIRRVFIQFLAYLKELYSLPDSTIAEFMSKLDSHVPNQYMFKGVKL